MPEYASFSLTLQSQYDAATIPESTPRITILSAPTLRSLHCESPGLSQQHPDKSFEDFQRGDPGGNYATVVIETTVPVLRGSQFWICYSCPSPSTPTSPSASRVNDDGDDRNRDAESDCKAEQVKHYFFKLFVAGKCLLSWGVGEKDDWKGKAVFGLFDGGRDFEGRRIVDKRGLFFASNTSAGGDDGLKMRVFRARARRSEGVRYVSLSETLGAGGSVEGCSLDFTSVGKVQRGERQRLYSYALIDPREEPYLVFRYRFESEDNKDETALGHTLLSTELEDTTTTIVSSAPDANEPAADPAESSLWSNAKENKPPHQRRTVYTHTLFEKEASRRLSFPPRNLLYPSTTCIEPSSPIKQQAGASDDGLTRPRVQNVHCPSVAMTGTPRRTGLRRQKRTMRASSPKTKEGDRCKERVVQVQRKPALAALPGSGSGTISGGGSGGLLKSVVASALRKRGRDERRLT